MRDDTISRRAAIDALWKALFEYEDKTEKQFQESDELDVSEWILHRIFVQNMSDIDRQTILDLPPAQPEQRWIPVKSRPMDEEERKEWSEKVGYELEGDDAVIYTSQLPDDGQECIVCTKWGNVFIDTFQNDPDYGCCFEEHGDMDGITAWMPLPKAWKGEKDE